MRIALMRCVLVAFGALFLASCRSESPRVAKPHPPAPVVVASPGVKPPQPAHAVTPDIIPFSGKVMDLSKLPDGADVVYVPCPSIVYDPDSGHWRAVPGPYENPAPNPGQTPRARFMLLPNATPYNERR